MDSKWAALLISMFIALAALVHTQVSKRFSSRYQYSSHLTGQNSIRLLRLMPNKDDTAVIECQLFLYFLEPSKGTHLYEALSYVWGDPNHAVPILIGGRRHYVTENLHEALQRLRDDSLERTLWIDAICINQADEKEKERQIQLMERIYGQASRVIVWLGVAADSSDRALEDLRVIAADKSTSLLTKEMSHAPLLALLQRAWFQRIWVLQEVAMARRVLVMCGRAEINGYTFCAGLNRLEFLHDHPGLQSRIRSVTYLIRGAIFRPPKTTGLSMDVSLGELMDMYHSYKATKRHDKVYALLGMSSDNPSKAGLSPNYMTPWNEVMRRLVTYVLGEEVDVETWAEREIAVIKSNGYILGQVSSVANDSDRYDRQHVQVIFRNSHRSEKYERRWGHRWILQASAKPLQQGDLICLLQDTLNPTIVRACKDHFDVIMIIVAPQHRMPSEATNTRLQSSLPLKESLSNKFLLVWSWEVPVEHPQDRVGWEAYIEINHFLPAYLRTNLEKAARLCDVARALEDSKEYEEAGKRLQEAIINYTDAFGREDPTTLTCTEKLALLYKKNKQWEKAEDLLMHIIQIRKRVQGADHPDALSSFANLAFTYMVHECLSAKQVGVVTDLISHIKDKGHVPMDKVLEVAKLLGKSFLKLLFELGGGSISITEGLVKAAAGNEKSGEEVMWFLLEIQGSTLPISTEVLKAVAGNRGSGKQVMKLLLQRRAADTRISEEVVKAAAWNSESGEDIMKILLHQNANETRITEDVVVQIARLFGVDLMRVLLDNGGASVPISERVVRAAVENKINGQKVVQLLLEQRGDNIPISDEMIKSMGREYRDEEVIRLLLERREDDILIPETALKEAAFKSTDRMMRLLLQRSKANIPISAKVVIKAVSNPWCGKEIIKLLLEKSEKDIPISEEVVEAATENKRCGKEVMKLILERRAKEINIPEKVVVKIASSFGVDIMRLLLDRGGTNIPISERVVGAAAGNKGSGEDIVKLLLERRRHDIVISEEVVIAAAGNLECGKDVMRLIFAQRRNGTIPISQEVLKAAVRNYRCGEEIFRLLLSQSRDVLIPEEVVQRAAGTWSNGESMKLLLEKIGDNIPISDEVVIAAAKNSGGENVLRVLFEQRGADLPISEDVVLAAASNPISGEAMIRLILHRNGDDIPISERVIKEAAGNYSGEKLILLLLERRGSGSLISEEVLKTAAKNIGGGKIMRILLEHKLNDVPISEEVVKAAAGNKYGGEIMRVLLERENNIAISEEVVKAAVGKGTDPSMVRLLLQQSGHNIPISEEVVKAAAWEEYKSRGDESLRALLEQRGDDALVSEQAVVQITKLFSMVEIQSLFNRGGYSNPVSAEVVKAAAQNERSGKEVMELLSERILDEVLLSEEVVRAAAANRRSGVGVIGFLFKRGEDDVPISEEIVKSAAGNEMNGLEVMRVLLERRGGEVPITVEVVKAIVGNRYRGDQMMNLLFEWMGGNVPITEEVVKVASGNDVCGERIVKLLLERMGKGIPITEDVVKVAAGNNSCGDEVMWALLERKGDDLPISEEVVKAAASNRRCGERVMRLLLRHRRDEVLIVQERIEQAQKG